MRTLRTVKRPVILGVDASLGSTGYAYRVGGQLYTGTITTKPLTGPARLAYARDRLREIVRQCQPELVVYEDYALSAPGKVFHIGELGGVYRTLLWEEGINVLLIGPTELKLMVAGHGHAPKNAKEAAKKAAQLNKKRKPGAPLKNPLPNMRDQIRVLFGYDIEQDDEADAFSLMSVGEIYLGKNPPTGSSRIDISCLKKCELIMGKGRVKRNNTVCNQLQTK